MRAAADRVRPVSFELGGKNSAVVFAARVGALDGRHPELEEQAMTRITAALAPGGRLFVGGVERTL